MAPAIKPIAVVQGAASAAIQQLLLQFAARWQGPARVVGVVEDAADESWACPPDRASGRLRNLAGGRGFPIFQDLGPGAAGCAVDSAALVEAGEQVRRDIAGGCDLVVLSKFGKLEAERGSGLLPAFIAALEASVPVITAVAPKFMGLWTQFAAPYFVVLPADPEAIEAWWAETRVGTPAAE